MSLHDPKAINIAIVGVGNCASSLVQGLAHYQNGGANDQIGLMHWDLGGYRPKDIKIVAAWDIDRRKVGKDVAGAIFEKPNCTTIFCDHVPQSEVTVEMGRVLDGYSEHMAEWPDDRTFLPADLPQPEKADVVRRLKETRDRRPPQLSAGGQPGGDRILRRMRARGGGRLRQQHPGVHRLRRSLGGALPQGGRPDHRRRHQGAVGRDHRPPRAHRPVQEARSQARADLPAQHRRQYRLPQHVEPQAARLQEDLEDRGGPVGRRAPASTTTTSMSARPIMSPGRTTTRSAS